MNCLPNEKAPRTNSAGAKYRKRQLAYQIPLQDFSDKHCKKLTLDQKMAMDDMCEKRVKNNLGTGKIELVALLIFILTKD